MTAQSLPTIVEVVNDVPVRVRASEDLSPLLAALAANPGRWCRLELNGRKAGSFRATLLKRGIEAAVRFGQIYARIGGNS